MKNKFFYYQLLDEREEQLMNKAGAESFHITIVFLLLSYMIAILAPSLDVYKRQPSVRLFIWNEKRMVLFD